MPATVENLYVAYYRRKREEGYGVPAAFDAMRTRFGDKQVPREVDEYRTVLADAYADHLLQEPYVAYSPRDIEIANDLADNLNAFQRISEDCYFLTEEGVAAARPAAHAEARRLVSSTIISEEGEATIWGWAVAAIVVALILGAIAWMYL